MPAPYAAYSLVHGNRGASAGAGIYLLAGELVVFAVRTTSVGRASRE